MKALVASAILLSASQAVACVPDAAALPMAHDGKAPLAGYISVDLGPVSKPFDLDLLLCGDLTAVKRVGVAAIMPAHQHGMNYEPAVADMGDGHFHVTGMVFHMSGTWQVQVSVYGPQDPSFFTLELDVQ